MGDHERSLVLKLYSEIYQLSILVDQCITLIEFLSVYKYRKYENLLNVLLNQNFKFTDKRRAELERCTKLLKGFDLRIMQKQQQLEALTKKEKEGGVKVDRAYFQGALISLSDFAKYHVNDTISTYEFCERCKRITEYIKAQKK